ncbi:MAG: hypothetical protein KatS3mg131_1637 [Candidatus Tectimicrobiota bacterium]|nr:MAG: hypothetical protein KatS3mg131_1637 [Candidatus Tectomicrobia bacterium]
MRSVEAIQDLLRDIARHALGTAAPQGGEALLAQTATEVWQVTQATVEAEDEPAFAW